MNEVIADAVAEHFRWIDREAASRVVEFVLERLGESETPKLCDACLRDEHHPDKLVKGCPCPCNPREVH